VPIHRRRFLKLGAGAAAVAASGCASTPKARSATSTPIAPLAGKVEHFIVLMLENRSYDQMLGALGGAYDGVANGTRLDFEHPDGKHDSARVLHGAPPDRFSPDPGHNFHATAAQIHGSGPGGPADMRGFARRYVHDHPDVLNDDGKKLKHYFTIYGDGRLPILQTLAKRYGVCTHWFSSLPSSTTPNRMFAHAGTSGGASHQGFYYARIRGRMILDKLDGSNQRSWRVYYHDMPHLWLAGDVWTKTFSGHLQRMGAFERDVKNDQLATYTFIEPQHIIPPWSSQHPSAGVSHGEKLIAHVYNTLASNSRVFEKSLLLIVYDEHGGFYDHVVPPGHAGWRAACPRNTYEVVRPDDALGDDRYAFDTLGPRVPAVVVSPWIDQGSIFGWQAGDPALRATFDHTSILATVGRMTNVWVPSARARVATPLDLTLTRPTPRDDHEPLTFDARVYRTIEPEEPPPEQVEVAGVAETLLDAFRAEHAGGTPTDMVEHFQQLVES
jgi:phospholipase C